jgi:hypothetical protein
LDESGSSNSKKKNEDKDKTNINDLPPFLQKLRSLTLQLFSSSATSNEKTKQSIEDVLDDLHCLEMEKQKCENILDDPKELLEEIREELLVGLNGESIDDEILQIRVQQRYEERIEEWESHQTRLLDRISILGDRLKSEYGIEAVAALRYIEANIADEEKNETECKETEPVWKVAADNELTAREREGRSKRRKEEKRLAQERGDDPRYRLELTEEAEDLGSSDEFNPLDSGDDDENDVPDAYDNGWRNAAFKAGEEEIEIAREAEDRRRLEEGKNRIEFHNKKSDMKEIMEWDAGMKSSSVMVKRKAKKKKKTSTRTISLPAGVSPTKAMKASSLLVRRKDGKKNIRNGNHKRPMQVLSAASGEPSDDTNIVIANGESKSCQPSSFVLSTDPFICIPGEFERHLKEHQKEGIKFMYKNTFSDLGGDEKSKVGGCVLAHSMGLGKFPFFLGALCTNI